MQGLLGTGLAVLVALLSSGQSSADVLLFEEHFEDRNWEARGWYDSPRMEITPAEHIAGSNYACVWDWERTGAINTRDGGARVRLPPVDDITLSFHIKHSENWAWTGVNWHPHEFHFITSADPAFVGPASTHLTMYVEVVNGVPRLAIQDSKNIDLNRIGEELADLTGQRAVAGCNGDSDGHGSGDCYRAGEAYFNGKFWEPGQVYFGDKKGPYYKGDWHHVEARFKLNSIADGVSQRDGVLQYWFDGVLIMDHRDIVMRTEAHPDMRIDQLLMAPYYGPRVPHPQRIWIDDLRIYSKTAGITPTVAADSSWGAIKSESSAP